MVRDPDFVKKDRSRLGHKVRFAARNPSRILPYLRRRGRDAWLTLRTRGDHLAYYRAVMQSDVARSPDAAVGGRTHDRWLRLGELQFSYLLTHGLQPEDTMLEIGCGNLRAGRLFIDYLDEGHYWGVDISPDILAAAAATLAEHALEAKRPTLLLVTDNRCAELPAEAFDVVHAHSVYSHCPLDVIDECFAHVGRILKPLGHFDLTFDRTEGREHHVLHEDFYYRTETLVDLARRHGLEARFMADWELLRHNQSKIRITLPGA